jgi:hypothetical protein
MIQAFLLYSFNIIVLQSVEEAECRRAFDSATEVYKSSFDRSKPPEEVSDVLCLSLWIFPLFSNSSVLGCIKGSTR